MNSVPKGLEGMPPEEVEAIMAQQARLEARQKETAPRRGPGPIADALPLERAPHLAGGEAVAPKRLSVMRLVRGLGPPRDGEAPLAVETMQGAVGRQPVPPAVRRARIARRAVQRGAPEDPGVLAVASALEEPPGEAVALLLGLLRRREAVCLEDWQAAHPGAPPPPLPPASTGMIVVLVGDVDTGKSAAAARAVAWHKRGALYLRAGSLPPAEESLRGVSFDRQDVVAKQRQRVVDVDLLVIDEVGTESDPRAVTEWALLRFPKKVTILLGNAGDRFFERYADPRFTSRVKDRQDLRVVGRGGGYRSITRDKKMHTLSMP